MEDSWKFASLIWRGFIAHFIFSDFHKWYFTVQKIQTMHAKSVFLTRPLNNSVIPKFMKFSQGTLALINNLTMPRGAYFQIFKEIIPNSKFAVIIWFWHFLANIFQFLALRITLSKIFFNKIYFKLHFIVCANVLLLLEVDLTLWIFIWKHSIM